MRNKVSSLAVYIIMFFSLATCSFAEEIILTRGIMLDVSNCRYSKAEGNMIGWVGLIRTELEGLIIQERPSDIMLQPGLGNPKVFRVAPNVLAITGLYHSKGGDASVNAGIIFTKNSILFIDSGMTIASAEFIWKLVTERMKDAKNIFLILTHHHSDHTFGMRVFKERGAKVIAHEGVREFLENDNGRYKQFIIKNSGWDQQKGDEILGDVRLSAPDQLVEGDEVLKIDGEEIHLLFTPGHVPTEICVYHPRSETLFAGDAIYEGLDLNTRFGGPKEWEEWIAQLRRLKKLEIHTIVPGHGKLCSVQEIDRNIEFLNKKLEPSKLPKELIRQVMF